MNLLVTGGAGLIGSVTVKSLLDHGHAVCVIDNLCSGSQGAVDKRAKFIKADVGQSETLSKIFREEQIEVVIHLAAFTRVAESVVYPELYHLNNFQRTLGLLECMRLSGVKKLLFTSSCAVYGNSTLPVDEEDRINPLSPYGRSKFLAEEAIREYVRNSGFQAIVFRCFNVVGSPLWNVATTSHIVPRAFQVARGVLDELEVCGHNYETPDGSCIRDYICTEDVASAFLKVLPRLDDQRFEIFNLGLGHGYSVREIIDICRRVTGHRIPVREVGPRLGDPASILANPRKFKLYAKWSPKFTTAESIIYQAWINFVSPDSLLRPREI